MNTCLTSVRLISFDSLCSSFTRSGYEKNESGWYFSQIGKGAIDYDAIIEGLIREKKLLQ
jgi:hypothetical protein